MTDVVDTNIMATEDGESSSDELKDWLDQHNVPEEVYSALKSESITLNELATFSSQDLTDWSAEHGLKTIVRRRFINAIESLPNSRVADNTEIVQIYIDKEEKEQISKFDEMTNSIKSMLEQVNTIKEKCSNDVIAAKEEINNVCDNMSKYIETIRENLTKDVEEMETKRIENYDLNSEYLNKLFSSINDLKKEYDIYLKNKANTKESDIKRMKSDIKKYETRFNEYIRLNNTPDIITVAASNTDNKDDNNNSNNARSNRRSKVKDDRKDKDKEKEKDKDKENDEKEERKERLRIDNSTIEIKHDSMKEIKNKLNKLIKIKSGEDSEDASGGSGSGSTQVIDENGMIVSNKKPVFGHVREISVTGANKYDFCIFDKKYTNIGSDSELKSDNTHIIIGANNHCYATLFNENGFNNGKHCWRMYYFRKKNSSAYNWLFFGIYPFGINIENNKTYEHSNVWGIGGNTCQTFHNGKRVDDKEMQFLYNNKINMIDMLVDFDNKTIKYKIVTDLGIIAPNQLTTVDENDETTLKDSSTKSSKKDSSGDGGSKKSSSTKSKNKHYKGSKSMNIKDMKDRSKKGDSSSKDSSSNASTVVTAVPKLTDISEESIKEYELNMNDFNKDITYTPHFNFYWKGTEIQVAKVNPATYGKNTLLVQWAKRYT